MLSSVCKFVDAHVYEAAMRGTGSEVLITGKGDFRAELTKIDLPRLRIRRGRENLARIFRIRVPADQGIFCFMRGPGQQTMHVAGRALLAGEIVVLPPNTTQYVWTSAPCGWNSISFNTADLVTAAQGIVGRRPDLASITHLMPPGLALSRLRSLLDTAEQLVKDIPGLFGRPDGVRNLEQELIHAMITCLSDGVPVAHGRAVDHHSKVIERFEAVLGASRGRPLYLAEICAATAVSERTLRVCCHAHLGMGPMKYFHLQRMHLARHALLLAEPKASTVTKIATKFGFWELGRFSVEYRALFGESPSTSLHRLPDGPGRGRRAWAVAGGPRLTVSPQNPVPLERSVST